MTSHSICGRVCHMLPAWAAGEITGSDADLAQRHVRTCARCSELLASFRDARDALRSLRPGPGEDGWTDLQWDDGTVEASSTSRRGKWPGLGRAAAILLLAGTCATTVFVFGGREAGPGGEVIVEDRKEDPKETLFLVTPTVPTRPSSAMPDPLGHGGDPGASSPALSPPTAYPVRSPENPEPATPSNP